MIHIKKLFILLLIFVLSIKAIEEDYKLVIHNSDSMAKCLDGTSPALYLHEGGDKQKFVVFFVGGGYCEGETIS